MFIILQIIEYNIPTRKFTEFSKNLQSCLPLQWLSRPFPITNIIFDPNNENVIIMHDDTSVFVLNKKNELPNNKVKLARLENGDIRDDSNSELNSSSQHIFQIVKKYKVRQIIFFFSGINFHEKKSHLLFAQKLFKAFTEHFKHV